MYAPRAGSSRELVVAEPAVATRTNLVFCFPCSLIQIKDWLYKMNGLGCFIGQLYILVQTHLVADSVVNMG